MLSTIPVKQKDSECIVEIRTVLIRPLRHNSNQPRAASLASDVFSARSAFLTAKSSLPYRCWIEFRAGQRS